ncbi:MAG: DUF2232 domain-containing protein, partial [Pseudomonadota bacterium]
NMFKNFALFTVSGKLQAFTVVFGFLSFGLVFPLAAIISGAALVLVTLYVDPKNATLITLFAVVALAATTYFLMGNPLVGATAALAQLTPSLFLASLLYQTRSLSFSLQAAAILGVIAFVAIKFFYPQDVSFWESALTPMLNSMFEVSGITAEESQTLIREISTYMTGVMITSIVLVHSIILYFGYWLFCKAKDSEQYKKDFREVRLGKALAALAVVTCIWAVTAQSPYIAQLCAILSVLFAIQGMTMIHVLCATLKKGKLWLVISYLVIIFVPQAIFFVIVLGLSDSFFNLRNKLEAN